MQEINREAVAADEAAVRPWILDIRKAAASKKAKDMNEAGKQRYEMVVFEDVDPAAAVVIFGSRRCGIK